MSADATRQQILHDRIMAERDAIEERPKPSLYRILRRIASNPKNHLAVGFGAGSVPGLAGNTALASLLEELELRPLIREVWGTSAGAAIGGAWSTGATSKELLALLDNLNRPGVVDFDKKEVFLKGTVRFLLSRKLPDGLVRGRYFREAMERALKVQSFEECPIPFRAIACTDDGLARKVVFREGPILPAIVASMCVPGVSFPIQSWTGEPYGYFDGAVVEKTPLISIIEDRARQANDTRLVVLCTHYANDARIKKPVGFLERLLSVMNRLEDRAWDYQLLRAQQAANCKFLVLNPRMKVGGMFDFSLARFHYLWARKYFKEQLSNARLAGRFEAR